MAVLNPAIKHAAVWDQLLIPVNYSAGDDLSAFMQHFSKYCQLVGAKGNAQLHIIHEWVSTQWRLMRLKDMEWQWWKSYRIASQGFPQQATISDADPAERDAMIQNTKAVNALNTLLRIEARLIKRLHQLQEQIDVMLKRHANPPNPATSDTSIPSETANTSSTVTKPHKGLHSLRFDQLHPSPPQ